MFKFKKKSPFNIFFILPCIISSLATQMETDDSIVKRVMEEYFKNVPDIDNKYIISEGLSKTITKYFNSKINAFPLFKISVKIDKTPIKIPWTVDPIQLKPQTEKPMRKRYRYMKAGKRVIRD